MACGQETFLYNPTHDGSYFKKRSDFEKQKLIDLSENTERHLELDKTIPDEYRGLLRSAAGQAKLLVSKKFKQFEELIESNLNPKENELQVKLQDLAGFWDLMMIEARSLYKIFADLATMAKDNWKGPIDNVQNNNTMNDAAKPARSSQRIGKNSFATKKSPSCEEK